jgi:hypothetical protein
LTNDTSGRRLAKPVDANNRLPSRRLTEHVVSDCFCPIGTTPFRETASDLQAAFQAELDAIEEVSGDVLSVREVRPVECSNPQITAFSSNQININFSVTTGTPDVDRIAALAVDAYNRLTQNDFCDPLFRRARSATVVSLIDNGRMVFAANCFH